MSWFIVSNRGTCAFGRTQHPLGTNNHRKGDKRQTKEGEGGIAYPSNGQETRFNEPGHWPADEPDLAWCFFITFTPKPRLSIPIEAFFQNNRSVETSVREETIDAFTLKPTRESRIFQNDSKVEHEKRSQSKLCTYT